jgi:tetratricopeptide (TPR) repeat protein
MDVSQMRIFQNLLYTICLFAALTWLGGCSGLTQYVPVEPPELTSAEQDRVGAVVEKKLLQMLGGPYHDKALARDLSRSVQSAQPLIISVADRSIPALYPLPGGRAIISRGLLAGVRSRAELEALLAHAVRLSSNVYENHVTRSMVEATEEVLSVPSRLYDPDSAEIRLAKLFEQNPCEHDCLTPIRQISNKVGAQGLTDLPASVKRLFTLQSGYDLLAVAQEFEKVGDQAKAIATYLQAAATTPDEPRILGSLGLAYLRAGELQPARQHLQKAVELQPDYYRTQMGLGYLYLQLSRYNQANQALATSASLLPVTENLFLLAEAREKIGDVDAALSLYRLVAESDRTGKLGRAAAGRLAQPTGVK